MSTESQIAAPETCGTCKYARRNPADLRQVECGGVPPTPVVMGQERNQLGQVNMAIQLMRPVLPATEPACGLYKFKPLLDLSSKTAGNG
jgi:hypothetical protein